MKVTWEMDRSELVGAVFYRALAFPGREGSARGWIEVGRYLGREHIPKGWDMDNERFTFAEFQNFGDLHFDGELWQFVSLLGNVRAHSLSDMGVIPNHYNQHQTFTTLAEAWAYLKERCHLDWPDPDFSLIEVPVMPAVQDTHVVLIGHDLRSEEDLIADDISAERGAVEGERSLMERYEEKANEYVPQSVIDTIRALSHYEARQFCIWLDSDEEAADVLMALAYRNA